MLTIQPNFYQKSMHSIPVFGHRNQSESYYYADESDMLDNVPEEDILEPLNPETPFEFLKKINEDVYNSFAKLFNQFINEIHLIVFNKTIVDSTIEILQTPTNTLDELRNNLKEAEQKVSCFMQATDYIHQLQRMIQDL